MLVVWTSPRIGDTDSGVLHADNPRRAIATLTPGLQPASPEAANFGGIFMPSKPGERYATKRHTGFKAPIDSIVLPGIFRAEK